MIKKIKKISKYVMNFLSMINAILVGLAPIWGWHIDRLIDTLIFITGILATYLVSGKLFEIKESEK